MTTDRALRGLYAITPDAPSADKLLAGVRAALAGGEPRDGPLLALLAPEGEMGGVEPLAAKQFSDRAGGLAGVRLPQDLELVLRGELASRGLRLDLRRRVTRGLLLVRRHRQNLGRPAQ